MRECQHRQILVLQRELFQTGQHIHQLALHQLQRFMHQDQIGIVTDITAGGAKVNDALGFRTLTAIGVHMAHHIMTYFFLALLCHFIIDVIFMGDQLGDLFIADVKAKFLLALRQRDPQPSPCAELFIVAEKRLHLLAA